MGAAGWNRGGLVVAAALSALVLGCEGQSRPEPSSTAFQARQPLRAAASSKRLGEDCTTFDGSECLSGLCFHYKPGPREGYVCSQRCLSEAECPEGWRCVGILPSPGNEYCVPPLEWTPRPTTAVAFGSTFSAPPAPPAAAPSPTGAVFDDGGL